ncbi:hypothetical protein SBOR_8975 [Sclerotinia borealis F-4128]|uniref:Uncharacterized protein n=1 Tax=Sclerotinia borealis (strain F-4128) TaxID=1432307 RepID=W9C426_SCLBF|nr:hypothetical protein SBOR_8975 [Sclerotinia borealis F-4128]
MAIELMYRRILVRNTPPCYFGEFVDATEIALGTDGTMAKENNEVQKLFESYIACCSAFDEWTPEQRALIPREIIDGAMILLRKLAGRRHWPGPDTMTTRLEGKWKMLDASSLRMNTMVGSR